VVLILTPFVNKPKEVVFDNTYKPNFNEDSDLLIRLDSSGRVSIVNGCNLQSGSYKANDDGSIKFSSFISTRIFCLNDKDSVYINALNNSLTFKQQGNQITLFSRSGQQTLSLTPIIEIPLVSSNIANLTLTRRVFFPAGNYEPSIKNDSDLLVAFTNDAKVSILNGCNVFSSDYFAYTNGSVQFSDFAGSQKYCRNDNDYFYLNALGDAYTYTLNGNQITFRDDIGKITIVLTRSGSSPPIISTNTSKNSSTQPTTPQITTVKTQTLIPVLNPGSQSVNSPRST
jgi:heat shock protein HslJ